MDFTEKENIPGPLIFIILISRKHSTLTLKLNFLFHCLDDLSVGLKENQKLRDNG